LGGGESSGGRGGFNRGMKTSHKETGTGRGDSGDWSALVVADEEKTPRRWKKTKGEKSSFRRWLLPGKKNQGKTSTLVDGKKEMGYWGTKRGVGGSDYKRKFGKGWVIERRFRKGPCDWRGTGAGQWVGPKGGGRSLAVVRGLKAGGGGEKNR